LIYGHGRKDVAEIIVRETVTCVEKLTKSRKKQMTMEYEQIEFAFDEPECGDLKVRKIHYDTTKPFLLGIHYARRMPCVQYAFGLYLDNKLIGVVTYGQPASPSLCSGVAGRENKKKVLELNRLVIKPEYNGNNYASYLVSHSLKKLPVGTFVVSYADWGGWHHVGYVYQATNWLYTGLTKARTDIYSESGHSRHYDKDETRRQERTAKHRYIFLVGSKRKKKEMIRELKYKVIPEYPKGDSIHYDIANPTPVKGEKNER